MRDRKSVTTALAAIVFFIFAIFTGCGGNAGSANNTPAPPSSGSGSGGSGSGGSGSGGSGSGSGGSSAPTVQWSSTMDRFVSSTPGTSSGSGQVTIDSSGNVAIQLSGGKPNTNYNAQFCPYPYVPSPNQCFSLATITTDSSGTGKLTIKFPKSGVWSGNFYIPSSSDYFNTADANLSGTATMALVPASGASGNPPSQLPQDPLSSGTVSLANGNVTITVKGATPNATYDVMQCGSPTQCYHQATLVTDASGNGSLTFPTLARPATDFDIARRDSMFANIASGFLNGFKVP